MAGTVTILGAGATKSVMGPLTDEILPMILAKKDGAALLGEFATFLAETFHVTSESEKIDYPGLPLLMSLLDTALARKQTLQGKWNLEGVTRMRRAVELGIFQVLEDALQKAPTNNHYSLLSQLYPPPTEPRVISLNYDLTIDTAMMFYSQTGQGARFPNYQCDIQTEFYRNQVQHFGTLLKLHGSLNWLYCNTCQRLDIGSSASMRLYIKIMGKLLSEQGVEELESSYELGTRPCPTCQTALEPLLVAPSHLKDYRNPHLAKVWYEAERILRECDRAVFIGYSLPEDDVEVIYLLKRGLAHLDPQQITVVQKDDARASLKQNPIGRRYHALFGDVDWHAGSGLDEWLNQSHAAASPN